MVKATSDTSKETLKKLRKKSQRQKKEKGVSQNNSQKGLLRGWTRATLLIRIEHLKKLKMLALLEESSQKDLLDEILNNFFLSYNIKTSAKKGLKQFFKPKKKISDPSQHDAND